MGARNTRTHPRVAEESKVLQRSGRVTWS
jgi:hypothetical protein